MNRESTGSIQDIIDNSAMMVEEEADLEQILDKRKQGRIQIRKNTLHESIDKDGMKFKSGSLKMDVDPLSGEIKLLGSFDNVMSTQFSLDPRNIQRGDTVISKLK